PQPERAVDVHPGAGGVRPLDNLGDGIERTRVHVSRLDADDRRTAYFRKRIRAHPSLSIDRNLDDPTPAEPQDAERFADGGMRLGRDHNGHQWRAEESVRLHIPTRTLEHRMSRGRQP